MIDPKEAAKVYVVCPGCRRSFYGKSTPDGKGVEVDTSHFCPAYPFASDQDLFQRRLENEIKSARAKVEANLAKEKNK